MSRRCQNPAVRADNPIFQKSFAQFRQKLCKTFLISRCSAEVETAWSPAPRGVGAFLDFAFWLGSGNSPATRAAWCGCVDGVDARRGCGGDFAARAIGRVRGGGGASLKACRSSGYFGGWLLGQPRFVVLHVVNRALCRRFLRFVVTNQHIASLVRLAGGALLFCLCRKVSKRAHQRGAAAPLWKLPGREKLYRCGSFLSLDGRSIHSRQCSALLTNVFYRGWRVLSFRGQ